jgi:hypothetical protein
MERFFLRVFLPALAIFVGLGAVGGSLNQSGGKPDGNASSDPSRIVSWDSVTHTIREGWNLLSVPVLQSNMTSAGVFTDDFGSEPFSVFQYDGPPHGYSLADTMCLGRYNWLNAISGRQIDAVGLSQLCVSGPLLHGWNLVGNPFPMPFCVSDLRFTDGIETKSIRGAASAGWLVNAVYGYGGGGYSLDSTVLAPWSGYWILTLRAGLTVEYDLTSRGRQPGTPERMNAEHTFRLHLKATSPEGRSLGWIELGTHPDGSPGFDPALDAPIPPPHPETGSSLLAFEGGEMLLMRDIRGQQSKEWAFVLRTDAIGMVRISWASFGTEDEVEVTLLHNQKRKIVGTSREGSLLFDHKGGESRFSIQIST